MVDMTERRLGYGFGLLSGGLFLLGALVSLLVGAVDLVVGHPFGALGSATVALVLAVVGALTLFFAYLASHDWRDRPLAGGTMLLVLAIIGWAFLGLGASVIALLATIFALLAGVLFLLEPAKRAATAIASA
jgi:hypothetical protein